MKLTSVAIVIGSVWLISGCGARTSEDELLGYQGGVRPGSGGGENTGGMSSGGGTPVGSGGLSGGSGGGINVASGGTPDPTGSGGGTIASGGGGSGGAFPGNLCCEEHGDVGCNVPFIEECVCEIDDYCCTTEWDRRCVSTANNACLAGCASMSTGGQPGSGGSSSGGGSAGGAGSGGAPAGNCCDVHDSPSCQNMAISACVCSFDSFCCNNSWDEYCVAEADQYCGAGCTVGSGGSTGAGGAQGAGGGNNSCDFQGDCGSCMCNSCTDEMAACQQDSGCFSIAWCVQGSSCLPLDCYKDAFCKDVIDDAGGLTGTSAQLAIELSACVLGANCPCQ